MHKRINRLAYSIVLTVFSFQFIGTLQARAEEHIRICGFNIAEFGEGNHPDIRKIDFIAKMLVDNKCDLIAIQEVGVKDQAAQQVANLRNKMNTHVPVNGNKYFFFITPQSGDERCAVIYRAPVVLGDEVTWLDEDKEPGNPRAGGKVFYRIPVVLTFEAGDFDFGLVIVHLTWGNLDRREAEVTKIKKFLEDDNDSEKDWIVVGDMNRYGKYKVAANKAFDQLLTAGWETKYRFPLLEAVTNPDDMKISKAGTDAFSTTVAPSKNLYDQFILTKDVDHEFGMESADGTDVGIIAFDMNEPFKSMTDHNMVKYSVSDHRPIWLRLRIDNGDDD